MQRFSLVLALVIGLAGFALAQESITGTITDASGEPLIGASVLVAGTTTGTVSDFNGYFTLNVPEGAEELIVSYTGYATQNVPLTTDDNYDIVLAEGVQLNDVVVTALGISREEKSLGYAVSQIDGAEVNQAQETNLVSALNGRVAGAQINNNNSGLGGSSSIILRGATSLTGTNQPLFVVDGTPIDNSTFGGRNASEARGGQDYGNMAQDINPNDIESISILKGGAAAALYGSRASNGVILITTKSGKARRGLGVTINSGIQFSTVAVLPDYQDEYGGGRRGNFLPFEFKEGEYPESYREFDGQLIADYAYDGSWGPALDGTLVRHWDSWFPGETFGELRPWVASENSVRDFYDTGVQYNNNVSIAGGSETGNFRLSYTNNSNNGVYPGSSLNRNTVNVSASQQLGSKFTASVNANYVNTAGEGRPGIGYGNASATNIQTNFNQWWQRQLDLDRLKDYQMPDGTPRTWNIRAPNDLRANYWESPYWTINRDGNSDDRDRVFGNLALRYDIMPGLSLSGFARTDYYTFRTTQRVASGSNASLDYYSEVARTARENNFEALLDYSKTFSDFSIDGQLGANLRQEQDQSTGGNTVDGLNVPDYYTLDASNSRPNLINYRSQKEVQSVYGRLGIGWRSMLYVDVTGRNDWSSALESGNNSYFYPSVSGSFVFSELIANSDIVSFGKIRGGFATVGNDTDPYNTRNTIGSVGPFGAFPGFAIPTQQRNFDLRSESITTWETGLEMRFLNDRAGFDLTYYDIQSEDLIFDVSVSSTTGFASTFVNAGLLENKGIELRVYGTPVQTENFTWNVGINYARNRNKVVELIDGLDQLSIGSTWYVNFLAEKGQPYGQLNGGGFLRDSTSGSIILDEEGLPTRVTNQNFGSAYPDFTGGISNSFTIYGFNINTLVDFRKGGQIYSVSNMWGNYSGMFENTVGVNALGAPIRDPAYDEDGNRLSGGILIEGVNEDGTPNETYVDVRNYYESTFQISEQFVYDASFVKLREVSISRPLPAAWFANNFISTATLSLTARNLAILYKNAPNIDPDAALSNGNIQGYENGQNPSVRSYGVNLNVSF